MADSLAGDAPRAGAAGAERRRIGASDEPLAGVALAAGAGTRLRPLTRLRPKPLCPVGGRPLVDHALERAAPRVAVDVAVNVHHGRAVMEAHLDGRVHVSVEEPEALGTAGARRPAPGLDRRPRRPRRQRRHVVPRRRSRRSSTGWDGNDRGVLVVAAPTSLTARRHAGRRPPPVGGGLAARGRAARASTRRCLRPLRRAGRARGRRHDGPFIDCGTPRGYLAANLAANGGRRWSARERVVEGGWSGAWCGRARGSARGERLVDAIRAERRLTVLVR